MIPRFKPDLGWGEFKVLFRWNSGAVEQFEKKFAGAFQAVDAVAFPYGRSAQWAFFKAIGLKGAEVIMPAYTCSVVAHAVILSGNKPCFIDIKLDDYNMDLDLVQAAINEHTRVIIATHTFGYPQDLDRLEEIVRKAEKCFGHKIWLMQDCCHAFGADWHGRMIGSSGDVAVYAFNISKIMTSIFGGMLTFRDQALANQVRAWRDSHFKRPHWTKTILRRLYLIAVYFAFNEKVYGFTWWLQEKTPLLDRFTKAYHLDDKIHFPPDYSDFMLDVEAAVGISQLKKYSKIIQCRRDNVGYLAESLEQNLNSDSFKHIAGATYSHFVLRVTDRAAFVQDFAQQGVHIGQLIDYIIPQFTGYKNGSSQFSNALMASKTVINIPIYGSLLEVQRHIISKVLIDKNFIVGNGLGENLNEY